MGFGHVPQEIGLDLTSRNGEMRNFIFLLLGGHLQLFCLDCDISLAKRSVGHLPLNLSRLATNVAELNTYIRLHMGGHPTAHNRQYNSNQLTAHCKSR